MEEGSIDMKPVWRPIPYRPIPERFLAADDTLVIRQPMPELLDIPREKWLRHIYLVDGVPTYFGISAKGRALLRQQLAELKGELSFCGTVRRNMRGLKKFFKFLVYGTMRRNLRRLTTFFKSLIQMK